MAPSSVWYRYQNKYIVLIESYIENKETTVMKTLRKIIPESKITSSTGYKEDVFSVHFHCVVYTEKYSAKSKIIFLKTTIINYFAYFQKHFLHFCLYLIHVSLSERINVISVKFLSHILFGLQNSRNCNRSALHAIV